jgi:hypothetical protein
MPRKKARKNEVSPFGDMESFVVVEEIHYGRYTIKPGDLIKIKNQRGNFKFIRVVDNTKINKSWIDCFDSQGKFRAFYVDQLKGPTIKRSRKKKLDE